MSVFILSVIEEEDGESGGKAAKICVIFNFRANLNLSIFVVSNWRQVFVFGFKSVK